MGQSNPPFAQAHDPPGSVINTIGHDRREVERACEAIIAAMDGQGMGSAQQFAVRLALEEAISNAIHHGNADRVDGHIVIAHHVGPAGVYIRVTDEGKGFDPQAVIDPTLDENLECDSGRGLLLMRAYMTSVEIVPPGNTVRMTLDRPQSR